MSRGGNVPVDGAGGAGGAGDADRATSRVSSFLAPGAASPSAWPPPPRSRAPSGASSSASGSNGFVRLEPPVRGAVATGGGLTRSALLAEEDYHTGDDAPGARAATSAEHGAREDGCHTGEEAAAGPYPRLEAALLPAAAERTSSRLDEDGDPDIIREEQDRRSARASSHVVVDAARVSEHSEPPGACGAARGRGRGRGRGRAGAAARRPGPASEVHLRRLLQRSRVAQERPEGGVLRSSQVDRPCMVGWTEAVEPGGSPTRLAHCGMLHLHPPEGRPQAVEAFDPRSAKDTWPWQAR